MSILYADDDRDDREIFAEALSGLAPCLKLIIAENGADVIPRLNLESELPSLIVLDMNMPFMTGLDCLKEIKKNERYANIPVVIFSTAAQPLTLDEVFENGADEYYLKASSVAALETFITNIITRYSLVTDSA